MVYYIILFSCTIYLLTGSSLYMVVLWIRAGGFLRLEPTYSYQIVDK